jgi:hypothetical protein
MLLSAIREAIRDKFSSETFTDDALDRLIASAVRRYSRYNPCWKTGSLVLIANQIRYSLPADCMILISVNYWPGETVSTTGILNAASEWPISDYTGEEQDQISLRVIEEIKKVEVARRRQGTWTVQGTEVVLSPFPSITGQTIAIVYGSLHTISASAYSTIPDVDLGIIRDLALAELIEGRMVEVSIEPDYSEGLGRIVKHYLPASIKQVVGDLRRECIEKYSAQGVVAT